MGRVYLGMSAARRVVAVKVIHADHARDREFRDRFKVEVAAARKVQAAFTAPVIDAGEEDDPPWLVTSLVAGPSLADVIKSQGPLPSASVWRLVAGLAEALAAVHACGIVHRDVTPGNVLLALDGPRLIDFGLARALGSSNLTATGIVIGTPAFLSPEHVKGDPVGPASDIFSLGSLMVFAATGAGPFGVGDPVAVFGRILAGEPDFRGLSGQLLDVVSGCLAKEPADRPTPAEVIKSVPADGLAAPFVTTQFWPASLDGFIRSYQASFDVVLPDAPAGSEQSTLPSKPPKEIAAEAAGLTELGQLDGARQLLTTAAAMRPDQEVAVLIAVLRAEGRHSEAEVVLQAATRRPGLEVAALAWALRQIGSGPDADSLLDQASGRPAEQVAEIVVALSGAGRAAEIRRLMRAAAATASRQPQAIVALVGALSSAGLGSEVASLTDMVAALVTSSQAAALGDAMHRSGLNDAAFSLYTTAIGEVALRAPREVASILRLAHNADQGALASQLIEALPVTGVIEVTQALLGMNQQKAALSACSETAARDPSATGALVDSLRDIGRPVDAYGLLDTIGTGSVAQAAQVIASLRAAGRADDADRVLQAFLRQGPEAVCDLLARLAELGAAEDGSRLAALVDPNLAGPLSELASSLVKRQCQPVADHLLARAAQQRAHYCCELIDRLLRPPPGVARLPRPPSQGSDFPAPERRASMSGRRSTQPGPVVFALHWRAHFDHGGLLSCLRTLRAEGLGIAAHEMLSYAARMPVTEVVEFAQELDWADAPGRHGQAPPRWLRTREAAALIAAVAGRATPDIRSSSAGTAPPVATRRG